MLESEIDVHFELILSIAHFDVYALYLLHVNKLKCRHWLLQQIFFPLIQFGLRRWRVEKIAKMDGQYCLDDLWMNQITLYSSINFSDSHPFSRSTPASSNKCNVCRCYDKSNNRFYVSMDISWFKMYNFDIRKQRICGWCNLAIANDFFSDWIWIMLSSAARTTQNQSWFLWPTS